MFRPRLWPVGCGSRPAGQRPGARSCRAALRTRRSGRQPLRPSSTSRRGSKGRTTNASSMSRSRLAVIRCRRPPSICQLSEWEAGPPSNSGRRGQRVSSATVSSIWWMTIGASSGKSPLPNCNPHSKPLGVDTSVAVHRGRSSMISRGASWNSPTIALAGHDLSPSCLIKVPAYRSSTLGRKSGSRKAALSLDAGGRPINSPSWSSSKDRPCRSASRSSRAYISLSNWKKK